jgi:enoyl-CoA hydratase
MSGADAIYAGFADHFVEAHLLQELKMKLAEGGSVDVIGAHSTIPPGSELKRHQARIDHCFGHDSLAEIVSALQAASCAWEQTALAALRRVSPLSAAATFSAIRYARTVKGLAPCLANEYRFVYRSLDGEDFFEGIRAAVIDKDRQPKWSVARIEDVSPDAVAALLAPLGPDEWKAAA